jgi:hypothetical protein
MRKRKRRRQRKEHDDYLENQVQSIYPTHAARRSRPGLLAPSEAEAASPTILVRPPPDRSESASASESGSCWCLLRCVEHGCPWK